jgi:hypothetical protein
MVESTVCDLLPEKNTVEWLTNFVDKLKRTGSLRDDDCLGGLHFFSHYLVFFRNVPELGLWDSIFKILLEMLFYKRRGIADSTRLFAAKYSF